MREVTKPYYYDPAMAKDSGYYVINQVRDGSYTWEWNEPDEDPCFPNETYGTIAEALEAAAKDWDVYGAGKRFLSVVLRAASRAYARGDA